MDSFRTALLLSMPQLQDPNFARTVVLLCEYSAEGAFGLVLNRPTDVLDAANGSLRLRLMDVDRDDITGHQRRLRPANETERRRAAQFS